MKATLFFSITVAIVIFTGVYFYVTRSQTVTVTDKYLKQRMDPKPKSTTNKPNLPMCGLDYYNIIVDYYIIDSQNITHKISEKQYWDTQIGDSIKVNS